MEEMKKILLKYNGIYKENNEIYRNTAKDVGLSECAFWLLYVLSENDGAITQSTICDLMYQPKQTVNSALKKLESEGYLELIPENDRRSKQIRLTEKGRQLSENTVDRVMEREQKAFAGLEQDEQRMFLQIFRKFTDLLKESMRDINKKED